MRAQTRQAGRPRKSNARGFSLIELLIVVAVILVIAAIAIPNFIRSKERANEAGAVSNLRTITTGEVVYSTTYGIGFSTNLTNLAGTSTTVDSTDAGLIDTVLASGIKAGYTFSYSVLTTDSNGDVLGYSINADPLLPGQTGDQHYYVDQSAIIRHNVTQPASPTDPSI